MLTAAVMRNAKRILNDALGVTGHMVVRRETVEKLSAANPDPAVGPGFFERLLRDLVATDPDRFDVKDFAGFCLNNMSLSNAQWQQDLWVMYETRRMRDGFFVEFGRHRLDRS